MSWNEELVEASWRTCSFYVQKIQDSLTHKKARYEFPYRDGALMENLGRDPRTTKVTAIIIGEDYLSQLSGIIMTAADGKAGTFTHPLLGEWQARCDIVSIDHDAEARDMAKLELEFTEDGLDVEVEAVASIAACEEELEARVEEVKSALEQFLEDATEVYNAVNDAIDAVVEFVDKVQDALDSVTAAVDAVRRTIMKAVRLVQRFKPDRIAHRLSAPLAAMGLAVQDLGNAHAAAASGGSGATLAKTFTCPADMSLAMLAHQALGDFARASEIQALNQIKNPTLVTAGTVLRLPAKK